MKNTFLILLCCCFLLSFRSDSSKLTDCECNGIPLYGKVKFVTSFPDFKIQYVESFPDFTVQVVESFPDFKIKTVESFPGLP